MTFAAILGLAACAFFSFMLPETLSVHFSAFALLIAGTAVLAVLALRALRTFNSARLIMENELMHACPAVVKSEGAVQAGNCAMEVSISCFGILLDTRVIRFNRKSNRLRRVEIGRDYISLSWGTEKKPGSARLLHQVMDAAEIQKTAERFLFETGIQPIVAGDYQV